jgi:hypothetical protein
MLDLQGTRIGRPGIELAYFFCSSTSPQQRKGHFKVRMLKSISKFKIVKVKICPNGCEGKTKNFIKGLIKLDNLKIVFILFYFDVSVTR